MAVIGDNGSTPGGSSPGEPWRLSDTPLGHELAEFCRRILGPGSGAAEAIATTLAEPVGDRLEAIVRAMAACRRHDGESVAVGPWRTATLSEATAAELSRANAALPQRQREALALVEMLRLPHAQMAQVMGLDPAAVASLLARSRLRLREELRGPDPGEEPSCDDRDRALRVLARRLDGEAVTGAETGWLFAHMSDCPGCERAHGMMLEAAVRYRAWGRG